DCLVKVSPEIVFKGGTSLSKCYGIVKRFSEDIDIHYATNKKPIQSEKKQFKKNIITAIENAQLEHSNAEVDLSRRDHNNYEVKISLRTEQTKANINYVIVDTYNHINHFHTEVKKV